MTQTEPRLARKAHGPAFERRWAGLPLWGYGFRPFFLLAGVFATLAIALWLPVWRGLVALPGVMAPLDWHAHEMIFGYPSAVIAGFLFTAVPNWTGRMPISGRPLMVLSGIWLLGRLAMLSPLPPLAVAVADGAFLPLLALVMGREIVAGRNWRNMRVLLPLGLLGLTNLWFHAEAAALVPGHVAARVGLVAVLALIMLIGGRIIPSFTRNWLARRGPGRLPRPFGRFDGISMAVTLLALLVWLVVPAFSAWPLALAAVLQLVRLGRWAGERTWASPLLAVLHVFYLALPLGFGLLALAEGLDDHALRVAGLHALGMGAVGGMTLSVMTRATLGHTGRRLESDAALSIAFGLVVVALAFRVAAALLPAAGWTLDAAALFWVLAFGTFCLRVGPWLLTPRVRQGAA